MTKNKTLTLDEILDELDRQFVSMDDGVKMGFKPKELAKERILQWVADTFVATNEPVFGPQDEAGDISMEDVIHGSRNSLRDEQRQILKDHGWKEPS